MANWCYNTIKFSGNYKNFAKQLEKYDYNNCGFEFVKNGRCIFSLEKIQDGMYSFESKWVPPLEELIKKARRCKFSFEINYEELSMAIYGRAYYDYETNEFTDYYLDEDVLNRCNYDDNDNFTIDGILHDQEYEYEWLKSELEKLINNK